jgi:hypothetical protein
MTVYGNAHAILEERRKLVDEDRGQPVRVLIAGPAVSGLINSSFNTQEVVSGKGLTFITTSSY